MDVSLGQTCCPRVGSSGSAFRHCPRPRLVPTLISLRNAVRSAAPQRAWCTGVRSGQRQAVVAVEPSPTPIEEGAPCGGHGAKRLGCRLSRLEGALGAFDRCTRRLTVLASSDGRCCGSQGFPVLLSWRTWLTLSRHIRLHAHGSNAERRTRNSVGVECAHEAGDAGHQAVSSKEQRKLFSLTCCVCISSQPYPSSTTTTSGQVKQVELPGIVVHEVEVPDATNGSNCGSRL